ncbi:aspartate carbamoyltransferase regulatory subunit [Candidatus Woesearchaeota archaeon]|nr:aspartate carbamoyltransferase regulatory subunit [Candidatus Woesearchaeota archaeon]
MAKYQAKREIKIPAIKDGTVIDHIPSRITFKIMRLIDPQEYNHTINLALNLNSKKMGKKGIIKLSSRKLTQDEVNKISILAPNATVSIIRDYAVKKKIEVKIPRLIEKIVRCSNPNCITNAEDVRTRFSLVSKEPFSIRCNYCERAMSRDDIKLN